MKRIRETIETAQSSSWMSIAVCAPWTCGCVFMRLVQFSAGKDSRVARVSQNKLVRPGTKCSSGGEESHAEQELNGLEEGKAAMTDEEGEGVGGEGEAGTGGWRVRVGPRNKLTAREGKNTMMPFRAWCTHCMMSRSYSSPRVVEKK